MAARAGYPEGRLRERIPAAAERLPLLAAASTDEAKGR